MGIEPGESIPLPEGLASLAPLARAETPSKTPPGGDGSEDHVASVSEPGGSPDGSAEQVGSEPEFFWLGLAVGV